MDKQAQAQQTLLEKVHLPVFFEKLASYGITPQNKAEGTQLIQLGNALAEKAKTFQAAPKSAGANSLYANALQSINPEAAQHEQEKQAAAIAQQILEEHPDIRDAALALI